jgi:putative ABC transport system permease protein
VQTAVVFVVVGVAAATGVLGLTLATNSNASFKNALAKRRAPDLVVMIDASKVTGAELARTRQLKGVTEAVGPYPATTITLAASTSGSSGPDPAAQPLTVVGRASRDGPLDSLRCFTSPPGISSCGSWPTRTGEIELSAFAPVEIGPGGGRLGPVGEKVIVTSGRTRPTLRVTGYADGVLQQDADAWTVPAEIAALQHAGGAAQEQMLYTFSGAAGNAQTNAEVAELREALPAGAIISSAGLSNVQHFATAGSSQKPPYVEAYAVIVLVLALLISAIIVATAVLSSYHRIGVLKSIGFTPAQVAASYLLQLAVPAAAGAAVGTVVGSNWAAALIAGWGANVAVPLWIELTVPLAVCAVVALAGLIPAVRAARLTAIQALVAGRSPKSARGSKLSTRAGGLPLPRPVALGIASAFSRPSASLATAAVIAAGLAAAVLAVGLNSQMFQLVVGATTPQNGAVLAGQALVRRLTVLVVVVAALGVLSAVIMLTRQRVHDLGVYKAIGATPRQVVVVIVSWVLAPAIVAAVIALPAGVILEHAVAQASVDGQTSQLSQIAPPSGRAGTRAPGPRPGAATIFHAREIRAGARRRLVINASPGGRGGGGFPGASIDVGLPAAYDLPTLVLLALAGLAVAIAGALGPAAWAAFTRTTTALHAE